MTNLERPVDSLKKLLFFFPLICCPLCAICPVCFRHSGYYNVYHNAKLYWMINWHYRRKKDDVSLAIVLRENYH